MRVDLLERFIALLERDMNNPKGVKFDMSYWAKVADSYSRYSFVDGKQPTVDCGTNACALGLAAISGEFAAEGLKYDISSEGDLLPTFNDKQDFEAGAELFGISKHDAQVLFDPWYYPRTQRQGAAAEQEVIDRIKNLIAKGNLYDYHMH